MVVYKEHNSEKLELSRRGSLIAAAATYVSVAAVFEERTWREERVRITVLHIDTGTSCVKVRLNTAVFVPHTH